MLIFTITDILGMENLSIDEIAMVLYDFQKLCQSKEPVIDDRL